MEPKIDLNRRRPTLTKHAQALSDCIFYPSMEGPFSDKNGTRDKDWPKISKKRPRTLFDGLRTRLESNKVETGSEKGTEVAGDSRYFFDPKSGQGATIP